MRIIINASDIATVVDKNPFKPKNELLEELCKKYNKNYTKKTKTELVEEKIPLHLKEKLDKAMKETSVLQNSEESQKILANFVEQCYQEDANSTKLTNSDANSTISDANSTISDANSTISDANSTISDANSTISDANSTISDANSAAAGQDRLDRLQEIIEYATQKINTTHGTYTEHKTATLLNQETGNVIIEDNKYYSYPIINIDHYEFIIIGKIDRVEIINGQNWLIEIKNRTKKLFKKLYEKENIQIQTYLQMTKLNKAKLVEQYNDEIFSILVDKDDTLWETIFPKVIEFCQQLHEFMLQANL